MSETTSTIINTSSNDDVARVETKKARSPIVRYDQIYDVQNSQFRLVKSVRPDLKKTGRKIVLVVRRIINDKGFHTRTEVDIKSPHVAKAMQDINSDVEEISLKTSPPVVPLQIFFHSQKGLQTKLDEARKCEPQDQDLVADLEVAAKFAEEEFQVTTTNLEALISAGDITWNLIWAIFSPNVLLYRHHPLVEEHQVLKLRTITECSNLDKSKYWMLNSHIVADDGLKFGLAYEPFSMIIDEFDGARKITDLHVYPLKYHVNHAQISADALTRGRRFATLAEPRVMEVSGPAMSEKRDANYRAHPYKFHTHGRAIIDPAGFRLFQPNQEFLPPSVHKKLSREDLTDEQLMICTPVAIGFCFGNKTWGGFSMSRLLDVRWNDQAFQDLVLDKPSKMLVHSLIKQHSSQDTFDDIVSGKGKGIICLFSGPPGSGKTLTAEAVAESTKRPLYNVSAGDLGVYPEDVDRKLTQALEQSSKWNAVLLLDEADVFLQQRTPTDVQRNALVSIFLRQLEYYQGILILTTNRIAQCDKALESRVHISIQYPDLDESARKQIWMTFIRNLREIQPPTIGDDLAEEDLPKLAKIDVNGRQIKNIFNSARIVAKEMGQVLSMSHIDLVLSVTRVGLKGRKELTENESDD